MPSASTADSQELHARELSAPIRKFTFTFQRIENKARFNSQKERLREKFKDKVILDLAKYVHGYEEDKS